MKIKWIARSLIFIIATPIIAGYSINALPSQAASFSTLSQTFLRLDNFSHTPNGVGLIVDSNPITVANVGFVNLKSEMDAKFSAYTPENVALAYSSTQTLLSGIADDYLGSSQISSQLLGSFFIPAGQDLSFDIMASVSLYNFTEDLQFNSVSSAGNISLYFLDFLEPSKPEVVKIFDLAAALNTNSIDELNQDSLFLQTSSNINITNANWEKQSFFGGTQEFAQITLSGSFQQHFTQNTQILLVGVTQSCNYSSNKVDVCVSVPENSISFGWLLYLMLMGVVYVLRRKK